ncbi:Hsp20 family protein [bacterium]|jgi:molecular chaperone IbpA|nr:Hsp20 family protein [bacterium]
MTRTKFNAAALNDPLFIGFDRMLDRMNSVNTAHRNTSNYPPYNIVKVDEDNFTIELALAGFKDEDIEITLKDGVLYVEGNQGENDEKTYLHRGLSARSFRRSFTIADTIVVNGADFVNGILTISLENVIPEEKKPRKIAINDGNHKAELLNG